MWFWKRRDQYKEADRRRAIADELTDAETTVWYIKTSMKDDLTSPQLRKELEAELPAAEVRVASLRIDLEEAIKREHEETVRRNVGL